MQDLGCLVWEIARVLRASFLPIMAAAAGLALSACMQTAQPVAMAQAPSDLDSMAYGPPTAAARTADTSGGGAISALRNAMANSQRTYVAAAAPAPVQAAYDC